MCVCVCVCVCVFVWVCFPTCPQLCMCTCACLCLHMCRDLRAKLELAITHTLETAQQQQQQQQEWQKSSSDSEDYTSDTDDVRVCLLFNTWLLNILATCKCILEADLLRHCYVLPHWTGHYRSSSSSAFPAISLRFTILGGEIFACDFFNPTMEVVTFCLREWCMLGVFFVTGIPSSVTWMSGSFESMQWNACVHRLDLSLYSHPKKFWVNGVRTHVHSQGKNPHYQKKLSSEEDQTHNATLNRTASSAHYQQIIPALTSQIKLALSPSHIILILGQPVPALTL